MVGNPVTDWRMDGDPSYVKMAHFYSLVGPDFEKELQQNKCNLDFLSVDPTMTKECSLLYQEFIKNTGCIFIYDIYRRPEQCDIKEMSDAKLADSEFGEVIIDG